MTKKEKAILTRHIRTNKNLWEDAYNRFLVCPTEQNLDDKNSALSSYCDSTTVFYLLTGEHWYDFEKMGDES